MNVEDLKELSRAVKTLAKHFATVIDHPLDDYPDPLSEEMDDELGSLVRLPRLRLARDIKLAYEKGDAPLIDTILSNNWQCEPEGVVIPDQYLKFVNTSIELPNPLKPKVWPPRLPEIHNEDLLQRVFTHKSVACERYRHLPEHELTSTTKC
jgi:hypothetical protein